MMGAWGNRRGVRSGRFQPVGRCPGRTSPRCCGVARAVTSKAFTLVYDLTSGRMFRLVMLVLGDRAEAERCTRDAYLEVWRGSGRFDVAQASALRWLTTIAYSHAVQMRGGRPGMPD